MENDIKQILEFWKRIYFWVALLLFFIGFQKSVFTQALPTPIVDTISINANGNPIISWEQNPDNRTTGYNVVWFFPSSPNGIWLEIGTVYGIDQLSYTDNTINACALKMSVEYRVYAFQQGTTIESLWSNSLKTINLADPQLNICSNTVTLNWTEYENMLPSLKEYQIFVSTTGANGVFTKIGTTTQTNFIHTNLAANTTFTYMVRAINSDGTKSSSSCKITIDSQTLKEPDPVNLRYATVENNEHIKLEWTVGNDASISRYKILRSTDGQNYDTIGENLDLTSFEPPTVFVDNTADFTKSNYYQIVVYDSCGAERMVSVNVAKTISLSGFPGSAGITNELSWTPYENWDLGIQEYRIYRKVNGTLDPAGPLASVSPTTTTFSDDVSSFGHIEGSFNYYVEAVETSGNNGYESFKDISTSNEIEIIQETKVVVPNAFTPELATNNSFKPFTRFIDPTEYSLSIYDKWGQMIFETQDFTKSWDGKHKGEYVDSDSYVYLLLYRTPEGQNIEKRGTVTVVR